MEIDLQKKGLFIESLGGKEESRDSSVGIATDYGLDDRLIGVRIVGGWEFFSSTPRPDRLWGPPSINQGLFPWG
jgi:hypothetical protein